MEELLPNDHCIDCYTNHVEFASINNGVYLCTDCAKLHISMGRDISYIVELVERTNDISSLYMQRGGNNRFYQFCKEYQISNLDPRLKYRTKAAEYYRKLLKSEICCDLPPEKISILEGKDILYNNEIEKSNLIC